MKEILLIGCGHMGNALLNSWIGVNQYSFTVIDSYKYKFLKKKYSNKKIKIKKSILELKNLKNFYFIILAVKPVDLNSVLIQLNNLEINKNISLISVIAGKKITSIKNKIGISKNIFRVMPNMPASIGESMNCIVSSKKTNVLKKKEVIKLFSYSGKTLFFNNEDQIDRVTAISGSGPGFIFNLIDAFEKAAVKLGFTKEIAKILVEQTFKGSIDLLINNNISAQDLVKMVATKGGTTEAGLKIMNKNNLHKTFVELTKQSYKKAKIQGK